MNKAIIIGNITRDPDARALPSGVSVCTFTVAVQRRFANAQGEREADFIPVVTWRNLADQCAKYLRKGSKVAVCGSIQTRSYEANDGTKRYVTEIVADEVKFLDSRASSGEDRQPPHHENEDIPGFSVVEDDDLPF